MSSSSALLDRAARGALALAAERPWRSVSLRDIAKEAGLSMSDLYGVIGSKDDVRDAVASIFDRAAADDLDLDPDAPERERVFDAAMARFDAMEAERAGLVSILEEEMGGVLGAARLWPRAVRTSRWLLELAGVDTSGPRGAARVQTFVLVLGRATRAWLNDEGGDLAKTMAALDRALADVEAWRDRLLPKTRRRGRGEADETHDRANPEPASTANDAAGGSPDDEPKPV